MLDRSIEYLTNGSSDALISGCRTHGYTPVIILDGFNESPEPLRDALAREALALQLRGTVRLIVTSRPGAACDSVLRGPVYRLDLLTAEEAGRFIAFLGAPIQSLAEILRTPLDLQIAAECAAEVEGSAPTQTDLFHAYVRSRLRRHASRSFRLLSEVASAMAAGVTAVVSEAELCRLAIRVLPDGVEEVLQALDESGLLVSFHGYRAFWHEKLQRFFQAEALHLLQLESEAMAGQLRSPRNEDALEFFLGGLKNLSALRACIPAIQSPALLLAMLRGDLGSPEV